MRTVAHNHGYLVVTLYGDRRSQKVLVHRLVAAAFIRQPASGEEVNHCDGAKVNNRVENLEWVTSSENNRHAIRSGLRTAHALVRRGEDHGRAKLTVPDVILIRELSGTLSQRAIARRFGMAKSSIGSIIRGEHWKCVA